MAFVHGLGWFNTRLMLTIVYFLILALPAIVLKLIRKDLLDRKLDGKFSYWVEKEKIKHTLEEARHQF
jgi:hypothetical protein